MNVKFLLCSVLLATCASAQADWFLRGTHNNWGTTPMVESGTNTVEVKNVSFASAGSIKFDRFGDWSQNYGIGGAKGGNIPVAAGTWNIKFYTDTKHWNISQPEQYHLRGTHNKWAEGDLLKPVTGSTTNYEICRNFSAGDAGGGPRFKVDVNGGWGADAFPRQDYTVSGWTKIIVNGSERKIVSVVTELSESCAAPLAFGNPGPVTLHLGETFRNTINTSFEYYVSSNPSVATVIVSSGEVTAVGLGTVTITAREERCNTCISPRSKSYIINVVP
ncbi:MAG TPA: Ig-like domain-containing protein [Cellvibrio sp.]|nr:Ig-like domain-containing protein [Cellvibrio sp.]